MRTGRLSGRLSVPSSDKSSLCKSGVLYPLPFMGDGIRARDIKCGAFATT